MGELLHFPKQPSQPLKVSLTGEALDTLLDMSEARQISPEQVLARGISLYKYVSEIEAQGGRLLYQNDGVLFEVEFKEASHGN